MPTPFRHQKRAGISSVTGITGSDDVRGLTVHPFTLQRFTPRHANARSRLDTPGESLTRGIFRAVRSPSCPLLLLAASLSTASLAAPSAKEVLPFSMNGRTSLAEGAA